MKSGQKERARRAEAKKRRRRRRGGSGRYEPLVIEPIYELNVPLLNVLIDEDAGMRQGLMGLRR